MLSSILNQDEKKRRRLALIISVFLLLAILTPIFIYRYRSNPFDRSFITYGATPSPSSPVVEVRRGSIKKTLLLDGELRAVRSRTIYGTTPEDVKIVYLPPEGTIVKAGDRLVELDSSTVLTRIKDSEERIVAAENEIIRARAQHEAMLRDLEVELSRLWLAYETAKLKAKIPAEVQPRREYQDAQLALEKARTEYENHLSKIEQRKKEQAAELQVKIIDNDKLKVQLDRAKSNLDGMQLRAPSDGMVIYNDHWQERRKLQVGDLVWMGWPVVRLPD
ncbi:MAG: hypothetical protein L0220_15860, partial [Acidobacteria bacterium]|nr:hypothetical protein [Acidobacteriota bacterium]